MLLSVPSLAGGTLRIPTPAWGVPFLSPSRFKAAHGGRASGKSHFFAELLVRRMLVAGTRAVCIREVQNTIRDSVRQLILDKIEAFGLSLLFEVTEHEIRGPGGGLIIFRGMQSYNAEGIKSLEGFDIAWVEEAQTLSAKSLRLLLPTIRKPSSELWFTWNPRYETDAVDAFFRGAVPPLDAIIREVNYTDNPFLPEVLLPEVARAFEADPDMAAHVWGGDYERVTDASYYAAVIGEAERGGRIGDYPYDPTKPVMTAWDLGIDDYTAIWFVQEVAGLPRVIDYYESTGLGLTEIFAQGLPEFTDSQQAKVEALVALERWEPFTYGTFYLPHDIAVREFTSGRSRVETVMQLGVPASLIRRGSPTKAEDKIAAARALIPGMRFNRTERVMLGVSRLRRYRRRENTQLKMWMGPLHDENSHGADAFAEFAINWTPPVWTTAEPALDIEVIPRTRL